MMSLQDFKPVPNPNDASYDGTLFETYGADWHYVAEQPDNLVWTLLDNGDTVLKGRHFVNRLGYFITEIPWDADTPEELIYD